MSDPLKPTLARTVNNGLLAVDAAASFDRMSAHYGAPIPCVSMWRSYAHQKRLRDAWLAGLPGYNFASSPEYSRHVRGLAIDVRYDAKRWVALHGAHFGWLRTDPREDWHFEYFATHDRSIPPTIIEEECFEMDRVIEALFRVHLKRNASQSEIDFWLSQYAAKGREAVYRGIAESQEAKSKR